MNKRSITKISGLVLCVLFFTLPLVQCSQDSSMNATAAEIAAGTGDLFKNTDGYTLAFILLIIPILLILCTFAEIPISVLCGFYIAGLAAQITFVIVAYSKLNEYKGDFGLTPYKLTLYNWLVIAIYAGMVGFTQYCIKQGTED